MEATGEKMTHDQLLDRIEDIEYWQEQYAGKTFMKAIRAVVELHKPQPDHCPCCPPVLCECAEVYPCPTIQAIEKALNNGTH